MEVADADGVDGGADQLFLAARAGCELGAGAILPRATCDAGASVSVWLFGRGAAVRVFADTFITESAQRALAGKTAGRESVMDGFPRPAFDSSVLRELFCQSRRPCH